MREHDEGTLRRSAEGGQQGSRAGVAEAAVVVRYELAERLAVFRVRLVHVLVVAKVRSALHCRLVLAIGSRSTPSELERQQHGKQQDEEALHVAAIIAAPRR